LWTSRRTYSTQRSGASAKDATARAAVAAAATAARSHSRRPMNQSPATPGVTFVRRGRASVADQRSMANGRERQEPLDVADRERDSCDGDEQRDAGRQVHGPQQPVVDAESTDRPDGRKGRPGQLGERPDQLGEDRGVLVVRQPDRCALDIHRSVPRRPIVERVRQESPEAMGEDQRDGNDRDSRCCRNMSRFAARADTETPVGLGERCGIAAGRVVLIAAGNGACLVAPPIIVGPSSTGQGRPSAGRPASGQGSGPWRAGRVEWAARRASVAEL
jgi:hypothetical protein